MPGFGFASRLPATIRPLARRMRNFALGIRPLQCPAELQTHHRSLTAIGEQRIRNALRQHFSSYSGIVPDVEKFLATQEGERDLSDHLLGRLSNNRYNVIPWIANATGSLKGSRVLEIGCGTGAATVALAEQGALVTATDFNEASLHAARERLAAYDLSADVSCASAADALRDHKNEHFDLIAFFAVLEHMTLNERLSALREAWNSLAPGGFLVVDETPNRLWYFDSHTSLEHFLCGYPTILLASIRPGRHAPTTINYLEKPSAMKSRLLVGAAA